MVPTFFIRMHLPSLRWYRAGSAPFSSNKELTNIFDDMLPGVMEYKAYGSSPFTFTEICEHFYFIMKWLCMAGNRGRRAARRSGRHGVYSGETKHRLRASETGLFYFEFQAPNRFKTHILDGTPEDLLWNRVDGRVWARRRKGGMGWTKH